MTRKRRLEIAYLYMRYCYRYGGLLDINHPRISTTAARFATEVKCDPAEMEKILECLDLEISKNKFNTLTRGDINKEDLHAEIAFDFVSKFLQKADLSLSDETRKHLRRFCDVCEVSSEEGIEFFTPFFEQRLKTFFEEREWTNTIVWL